MVNSQLIFSKPKIFLSGNILGKGSTFITSENNHKIYFTKRVSGILNVIGITQHNLANNVTIRSNLKKTFIHHLRNKKNIQISLLGEEKSEIGITQNFFDLSYIDQNANYLFDGCFNFYNMDDIKNYTNNFTMYYNYGFASPIFHNNTNNASQVIEEISLNGFLDFSYQFTNFQDLDISFLYLESSSVSFQNINASIVDYKSIKLTIKYPSKRPSEVLDDTTTEQIRNWSNQIKLSESGLLNNPCFLNIDYMYFNSTQKYYYLYPFVENIKINDPINLTLLQLEEGSFNLEIHFSEESQAFSIFNFIMIPYSPLSTNTYYLHYNNNVLDYQIIDVPIDLVSELINTGRTQDQGVALLKELEFGGVNPTWPPKTTIKYPSFDINNVENINDRGFLTINIKSLTRLFAGTINQQYRIFVNLPDIEIVSNIFTINYEILCNPYLCPLPAFPNRISQISAMGSANSFRMQFSNKIRNASHKKAKKIKFITKK